jgi:carboxypeptidase family protein/TonB-dependent receptor-like protein
MNQLFSRMIAQALCLVFTFLLTASTAGADDLDNILFEGVVRDIAGAVLPFATVAAVETATGVARSVTTNEVGKYRISCNMPGRYQVKASASGFTETTTAEINANAGRAYVFDFNLAPSGASEQVVIASTSESLVDTARTVVGDTISRRELDELPIINRDPLQLVFLLGGIVEAPLSTSELADEGRGVFLRGSPEEAGIFSVTGASATSNNITIDGLDNNDDRAARERATLSPESIAEFQIITNQYAAEYGRASGGRINIRTRGGTNRYNADGYFYFGDESLNANTYFRNARGLGRAPEQQRREGAVISGPIRKQRNFFLASCERLDITDFVEVNALVPVKSNHLFPLPQPNNPAPQSSEVGLFAEELYTPETRNLFSSRFDFNFGQSHNASARLDAVRGANKRGFPGASRLPDTILIEGRNSDSISFADNFIASTRLVNQARFQYSRLSPRNKAMAEDVGVVIEEPSRLTAGAFTGSDSSPAFAREEKRAQFQENVSMLAGRHLFKAGMDVQLVNSIFADLFATGGQYTFGDVNDFLADRANRFVQRFNTESRLSNRVVGLFAQDEWKVMPNLTLSTGIRWDSESILEDRDNFSPRFAIAWDPFGGKPSRNSSRFAEPGKTAVRAGFGLFYNRALLRTIDDFSLGRSTIIVDSDISPDVLEAAQFPNPIADQTAIERFGVKETGFLRRVSKNLEIPYTLQTGMGIERQINKRFVITADYIFTRGAHLWRETNINAARLPEGFINFTEFLRSRDFDNRAVSGGKRPISGSNADAVRFDLSANTSTTSGAIRIENGIRVLTLGLNAPRSSNIAAALNVIRSLRPDASLSQVEMLESTGSSFYHGGIFSVRYSFGRLAHFRAVYTISKLIDEGTTNTASPQDSLDRRAERALSLQDQRHRFTLSGLFKSPLFKIDLAPIISFGSSRPFNIGTGFDRNLNDIENDRPNFLSDFERPIWRRPGSAPPATIKSQLALAPIGSSGNLPRNYGRGPGTRAVNLRASRSFSVDERIKIRPSIDVFNLFNSSTFSFGSEFINRDDADFLTPRRTQKARVVQVSVKLSL